MVRRTGRGGVTHPAAPKERQGAIQPNAYAPYSTAAPQADANGADHHARSPGADTIGLVSIIDTSSAPTMHTIT